MKILVTDGDYKHTLGIVRSLGSKGHQVSVLVRSRGELAARSRYCQGEEFAPGLTIENCAATVLDILRRNRYDLLIPVGYATTLALAKNKENLTCLTRLETAEASQIEFAGEKRKVAEFALTLGLRAPIAAYPENFNEAVEWAEKLGYPLILKFGRESLPKGVRQVRSQGDLVSSLKSLCEARPECRTVFPMLQKFVEGYGCGFFALYEHGTCKRVFMHRRIRENPPDGGGSCCAESFYDPELKRAGMALLDAMNWHGVAMVEFRYDTREREYKLLEVNPKFWGSLDLALAAGADFPNDLCQMARGESLCYREDYRHPLRYHWPLSGEIQHLWRRPTAFGAIAADLLDPRVKSNIWPSDIRPNAQEFISLFGALPKRILRG